jgi:hypothetical protein
VVPDGGISVGFRHAIKRDIAKVGKLVPPDATNYVVCGHDHGLGEQRWKRGPYKFLMVNPATPGADPPIAKITVQNRKVEHKIFTVDPLGRLRKMNWNKKHGEPR